MCPAFGDTLLIELKFGIDIFALYSHAKRLFRLNGRGNHQLFIWESAGLVFPNGSCFPHL